jgi:nucleotide-binding universal stress UspA family protein
MLDISWLLLHHSLAENIQKLVDEFDAVLCILHQTDAKKTMPAFRKSSIAFLFVNGEVPRFLSYKNVLVPVDFRKASKDTSLWASYFGRFNKAQISLLYASETERERTDKTMRNLNFFRKFLSSLNVKHTVDAGKSTSWRIHEEAILRAEEFQSDVIIISGSSNITLLDLIIGLPEKKLLAKAGNLPVLMINPRKDICMMCD